MPHLYFLLFDTHLYLCRQFEQAEVVGHRCAFLAHALRHTLLRQVVIVHQPLVSKGYLDGIQVLTLYVFYQGPFHHLLVLRRADVRRDALKAGNLACAETPLSGNNHIGAIPIVTQRDG